MIIKRQSFMTPETEQQYKNQIAALQAEIEKLKNQQTKAIQREKYGLNWIDVPEEFDEKSKNSIPVLKEIKNKAIKNNDGKPTHILIEGDNYHALTCLNYTHAGKIDVIYIDPPYNTGSDGFTYKDARFMTEFPNGKTVPKDDPLRHSTWLSFMEKRLRLAKNLLSDKGVIFISIDDNEQANLKLLCDQIFGEKNFVANIIWERSFSPVNLKKHFSECHDYIFLYGKNIESTICNGLPRTSESDSRYSNPDNDPRGPWTSSDMTVGPVIREKLYDIISPSGRILSPSDGRCWLFTKERYEEMQKDNRIWFGKNGNNMPRVKKFISEVKQKITPMTIWKYTEVGHSQDAAQKLKELFGGKTLFDYPKSVELIKRCIQLYSSPSSTILDFFAGSGTTLHATMKLNAEDGGNRQCILVQQQENDANICETITYERNRRVIQGYTNAKGEEIAGLGNSLKYYKTDFIGENDAEKAGDEDKITLAQKAGYLISLVENTLEEIETNDFYQIFSNAEENQFTAIYFNGDTEKFPDFVQSIQEKNKKTIVYIFTWGSPDIFENEFDDLSNITIKSIPQPILEIYKSLMKNEE